MRKINKLFAVSAMLALTLFSSCEKDDAKPTTGEYNLVVDGKTFNGVGVTLSEKVNDFYLLEIEGDIDFKMYIEQDTLNTMKFPGVLTYKDKDYIGGSTSKVNIITSSVNLDNDSYPWGLSSYKGDVKFISKNEIELINCSFKKFNIETNNYLDKVIVSGKIKY